MLSIVFIFLLILFVLWYLYIKPLSNINQLQDQKWVRKYWEIIILGLRDKKLNKKIGKPEIRHNISLWYQYNMVKTQDKCIFIILRNINKFSQDMILHIYYVNFKTLGRYNYQYPIKLKDVMTFKKDNQIHTFYHKSIIYHNILDQDINRITTVINTPHIGLKLNFSIVSNKTVQLDNIPRYSLVLHKLGNYFQDNIYLTNQILGKVKTVEINGLQEKVGDVYFETGLGTNNYFLSKYQWFVLLNKSWCFWFTNYAGFKWVYLRDNTLNKIIYCGLVDYYIPKSRVDFNITRQPDGNINFFNFKLQVGDTKISIFSVNHDHAKINFPKTHWYKIDNPEIIPNKEINYYRKLSKLVFRDNINLCGIEIQHQDKKERFQDWVLVNEIN